MGEYDNLISCLNEIGDMDGIAKCFEAAEVICLLKQQREELQKELDDLGFIYSDIVQQRDELLASLRIISRDAHKYSAWWASNLADEAIAKAQVVQS